MKENNNVEINEILESVSVSDVDGDMEGSVSLWDLVLESVADVVGDRIMNGNEEYNDEAFTQIELSKRYVAADISSLASLMEHFGKTAHSVAEWAEKTYGISPITGDSPTDITLLFTDTAEEIVRPRKRGQRCSVCSNMTKKELKKHDSCPSCGRSLFALKSRGW